MANDLDLGDLKITISTFEDKPHEAVFTLPNGSIVARRFPKNGELDMRLGLGLGMNHLSLADAVAPPYVEPEEEPDAPPGDSPTVLTPPEDTPTDPDTSEPEPGVDPTFVEPTRIEITDQKQTVIRTSAEPNTWGNAYVAAELTGYDYWEIHVASSTPRDATIAIGVTNTALPLNGIPGNLPGTVAYWSSGAIRNNSVDVTGFATFGRNDKIGVARDRGTGRIWFAKNGTWLGSTPAVSGSGHQGTLTGSGPYFPFVGLYSSSSQVSFKFIASKFSHAVPSGFAPIGKTLPSNTVLPAITGTATVDETLTASTGTWTGAPTSYAYQWKDDGVAISGATSSTYVLTSAEIGGVITVTVTATNAGGSTSATSNGTAAVEDAGIEITNTHDAVSTSTNPTFSSVAFGAAHADRYVFVTIAACDSGFSNREITGVTIGGVTATRMRRVTASTSARNGEIWYAAVPTGTSGDVVVAGGYNRWSITAYRVVGLASITPTAQTSGPPLSITVQDGGIIIAIAILFGGGSTAWHASSGLTEDYNVSAGSLHQGLHGHGLYATGGAKTLSPSSDPNSCAVALL